MKKKLMVELNHFDASGALITMLHNKEVPKDDMASLREELLAIVKLIDKQV